MRQRDSLVIEANVKIEVRDAGSGKLIKHLAEHNIVPLVARNAIRDFLFSGMAVGNISHFGYGTGTNDPVSGDTALQTEVYRDAITKKIANAGQVQIQQFLSSTQCNGYMLTEAALFNDPAGGTLFARVKHQAIEKTTSLTVTYSWTININAG
jgi:hypothetical protein